MKKVMCFGTFDFFHPGHEAFLHQAGECGEYLIVVVARDKNVKKIKGHLPVQNENLRLKNIQNKQISDQVILGKLTDRYEVIRKNNPDIICLGYDQVVDKEKLTSEFKGGIIRLKPFKTDKYKSSIYKEQIEKFNDREN